MIYSCSLTPCSVINWVAILLQRRRLPRIYHLGVAHSLTTPWTVIVTNESQYSDVIMNAMASRITGVRIIYATVSLGADQRKHQSSASLVFVWGIDRWIPAQWASGVKNVSIWWRNYGFLWHGISIGTHGQVVPKGKANEAWQLALVAITCITKLGILSLTVKSLYHSIYGRTRSSSCSNLKGWGVGIGIPAAMVARLSLHGHSPRPI